MRIGFFLSSQGGSPLVVGLQRGLESLGHSVESYDRNKGYDLILIFNQCSHVTGYIYPEFPDGNTPLAFVDSAEYGYFKRLPGIIKEYANAFAPGSMSHDTKNAVEQGRLKDFLAGKSFPYFLREHSIYVDYPATYHPIDYPLYAYSACPIEPNRDEYLRRQLELFVSWGASHPWRMQITQALRECHTKCEIQVLQDGVVPRMPQGLFFQRTRAAKASVSFDGYGSGSFRIMEVLVRTLLLQGPLTIRRHAPLIGGTHCIEYQVSNEGENFLSTDVCGKLKASLSDPEGSFNIYAAGYWHCMDYYTEKATAEYLLQVISKHDFRKETPLTL